MLLATLRHLVLADIDAITAYTQAIDHCGDEALARTLSQFRADHHRHVRNLGDAMERLGGRPPRQTDFSGFAIASFTAIAADARRAGALTAMESNEAAANDAYRQTLSRYLPDDIRRIVERNHADEEHHLATIRRELHQMGVAGEMPAPAAADQGWARATWTTALRRNVPAMLLAAGAAGAAWLGSRLIRQRW